MLKNELGSIQDSAARCAPIGRLGLGRRAQDGSQRRLQIRVMEAIAELFELRGINPLAGKEQGIGHFTKGEAQSERRRRKNRRPVKYPSQNRRKRGVLNRVRRNRIGRAAEEIRFEGEADDSDDVVQSDPGDPLEARSNSATDAKTKRESHLREGASLLRKDHTEAQNDDARAPFCRTSRFGFPVGG